MRQWRLLLKGKLFSAKIRTSEMTERNSDEYESYEEISDPYEEISDPYEDISGISTHSKVLIDQEHTKDPQITLYKRSSVDYNDPKAWDYLAWGNDPKAVYDFVRPTSLRPKRAAVNSPLPSTCTHSYNPDLPAAENRNHNSGSHVLSESKNPTQQPISVQKISGQPMSALPINLQKVPEGPLVLTSTRQQVN